MESEIMDINKQLIKFLNNSHSHFHGVNQIKDILLKNDFIQLKNDEIWKLENKKYFTLVNDSAVIAFDLSDYKKTSGYKIVASHTDAPAFKIKPNATKIVNDYILVNTEAYGGLINYTWFDRPLKLAGRVIVKNNNKLETHLFNSDKAVGIIPSLAIHMNREVNNETKFNRHTNKIGRASCRERV